MSLIASLRNIQNYRNGWLEIEDANKKDLGDQNEDHEDHEDHGDHEKKITINQDHDEHHHHDVHYYERLHEHLHGHH